MRKLVLMSVVMLAVAGAASGAGTYKVTHDFETSWSTDWAPGWESEEYRHGAEPIAKMRQVDLSPYGRTGNGAEVYMAEADWHWWGNVEISSIPNGALDVQYDPWVSVDMYDPGYTNGKDAIGQLYTLPSGVVSDDWTDVQFGGRPWGDPEGSYYYTWADAPHPDWQKVTSVIRPNADAGEEGVWRNFKIQLLSSDNKMHYYLDGVEVGVSTRDDYLDLGGLQFSVMFDNPLSDWVEAPSVIIDNYEYGSAVPEPLTMLAVGSAVVGLGGYIRRRRRA